MSSNLALCWVHEGRHYKKLSPFVAYHQEVLDKFLDDFWNYYRELTRSKLLLGGIALVDAAESPT